MRNRSGMFVAPERRISSWVMTKMAAAVFESFCSFFETEVTSTFIRSSMLVVVRSFGGACCVCPQDSTQARIPRRETAVPRNPKSFGLVVERCFCTDNPRRDPCTCSTKIGFSLISKTLLVSELADPRQCQKGPLVPNRCTCFILVGDLDLRLRTSEGTVIPRHRLRLQKVADSRKRVP